MAASSKFNLTVLIILSLALTAFAELCESKSGPGGGECRNKAKSLKLKLIAIALILISSMIGVSLPLFSHSVPALKPDKDLFSIIKAFASGVILATGYMHVLPDSFDDLTSDCLPANPWRKFPFTTFVAMLSALVTLMVDSFAMSYYKKLGASGGGGHLHHHHDVQEKIGNGGSGELGFVKDEVEPENENATSEVLLRHRVVAQVLELGIVVHSVVIGLSMGASDNQCTIKPLIIALCFHQLFEGMGLGGCILQAEYGMRMKAMMVFFFSATTPFGIALGIGLSNIYSENSPTALIVVGLLNASSAGLLNYMALVDLLAADFMGPKLQQNVKLQMKAYLAVLLGAGSMSLMAKWA